VRHKFRTAQSLLRRTAYLSTAGAVAATATLMFSGVSGAAPSLGSSGSGSVGSGSTVPAPFQEDPGPRPVLRDDILVPKINKINENGKHVRYSVESPALRRAVTLDVLLPADNSVKRPTLYMLDGVSAGDNASGWMYQADAKNFFANKNVNVVMLNGGRSSVYTDWETEDPILGLNRWETFTAKELPPLIDDALNTNGVNAIAGNSMGAQAAMMLAHRNPKVYAGVASFSGCYSTTDAVGRLSIQLSASLLGGDPGNIWGEFGNEQWRAHDSVRNAEALRGKEIYMSVGSGLTGPHEDPNDDDYLNRVIVGGAIEAGSNQCTRTLENRLNSLRIPSTVTYEPVGIHNWPYWKDQLPKAWPTIQKALGL